MTQTSTLILQAPRASCRSHVEFGDDRSAPTSSPPSSVHSGCWRVVAMTLAVCMLSLSSGCATGRGMSWKRHRDPMAGAPCLKNITNPSIEEVVEHLNQNTDRIQSWQAKKVRIKVDRFVVNGMITVEKERRLRLQVASMRGREVDLGSNDERFWVWARDMEPGFVTCKHENMEAARHQMGIPFEPDWLMQTLGVARLPTTGVTIETDREHEQARLIEQIVTAHGFPLRRVVLVDLKRGIVLEHSLYNNQAVPIAQAKLSDHRLDPDSGAVLAHEITLDWQQNKTMKMELGDVQINPTAISLDMWEIPEFPHTQVVHLDAGIENSAASTAEHPPAAERWEPVQTVRSHDAHNFLRNEDHLDEQGFDGDNEELPEADFVDSTEAESPRQNRFVRDFDDFAHETDATK